jgi:hypothetical protein
MGTPPPSIPRQLRLPLEEGFRSLSQATDYAGVEEAAGFHPAECHIRFFTRPTVKKNITFQGVSYLGEYSNINNRYSR